MKKILFLLLVTSSFMPVADAQTESPMTATVPDTLLLVKVEADPRLDILGKKLAEYNVAKAKANAAGAKVVAGKTQGYRLMVVNSSDKAYAMEVRAYLLKKYDNRYAVHTSFVNPYIKVKFGDFVDKSEATNIRKQLMSSGVIKGNIYIVPEMVIVKRTAADAEDEEK